MKRSLITAVLLGGTVLSAVPSAHAGLIISGDISGSTFTCVDNNIACDTNPATGTIQLANQTINGVAVNGSIQTSQGTPANPNALDILNTSSLSIINNSGANRNITFTVGDTNFRGPVNTFDTAGSGTWQTAVGSNITMNWYNDPTNQQGAESASDTPGTLVDTFSHAPVRIADAFSHTDTGPISDPSLFSMTIQATGLLTPGAQLLNRGQNEVKEFSGTPVSEPGSIMMLGSGAMMLVGALAFRRRKENSDAA
jgi:hypothetical protein